VDLETCWLCPS